MQWIMHYLESKEKMYYLQSTKMETLLATDDYYYYCIIPWILGKCFAITRITCSFQQLWVASWMAPWLSVRKLSPMYNGTKIKI